MVKTENRGAAPPNDDAYEEPAYDEAEYEEPPAMGPGTRVIIQHEAWKGMCATVDKWLESKQKWGLLLDTGKKVALADTEFDIEASAGGGGMSRGPARGGGMDRGGGGMQRGGMDRGGMQQRGGMERGGMQQRGGMDRGGMQRGPALTQRPGPYGDEQAPMGREDRYGGGGMNGGGVRGDRGGGGQDPRMGGGGMGGGDQYSRQDPRAQLERENPSLTRAPYGDSGGGRGGEHNDQRYMYNMGLVDRLSEEIDISGSVGLVIGKGGENIKRITAESNARINITGDSGRCIIEGGEEQIRHALYLIEDLIERNGGRRPFRGPPQPQVEETINCPGKEGWIIGRGGENIKRITNKSGARVKVDNGKCTITGRADAVQTALEMVEDTLGGDEGGRYRGADFSMGL